MPSKKPAKRYRDFMIESFPSLQAPNGEDAYEYLQTKFHEWYSSEKQELAKLKEFGENVDKRSLDRAYTGIFYAGLGLFAFGDLGVVDDIVVAAEFVFGIMEHEIRAAANFMWLLRDLLPLSDDLKVNYPSLTDLRTIQQWVKDNRHALAWNETDLTYIHSP